MTTEKNEDIDNEKDKPWLLTGEGFLSVDCVETIGKTLCEVCDCRQSLTIVPDGTEQIFEGALLVKIEDGSLYIDKPLDWDGGSNSFRVFFRNQKNYWCSFRARSWNQYPFSLSVEVPETIFLLQRRRYKRVAVPAGTRAMVKNGHKKWLSLYVQNISASGMLFCDSTPVDEYLVDDSFHDIVISIPRKGPSGSTIPVRKVLPMIGKASIVRSFVDEKTSRSCYGLSFEYNSNLVREELCRLVKDLELAA